MPEGALLFPPSLVAERRGGVVNSGCTAAADDVLVSVVVHTTDKLSGTAAPAEDDVNDERGTACAVGTDSNASCDGCWARCCSCCWCCRGGDGDWESSSGRRGDRGGKPRHERGDTPDREVEEEEENAVVADATRRSSFAPPPRPVPEYKSPPPPPLLPPVPLTSSTTGVGVGTLPDALTTALLVVRLPAPPPPKSIVVVSMRGAPDGL